MTTRSQRLDSVADLYMGQAPSGEAYNSEGEGWPLLAGAGDFKDGLPAAKKFTREAPRTCIPGDIVIGVRASIGDKVVADREYCLGRGVAALRPRAELHDRYLWHWLSVARQKLEGKGKGATFKQVTKEDVAELEIPLPPLEEQRRIAAILDKAEQLILLRQQSASTQAAIREAIFLDMFGNPAQSPTPWALMPLGEVAQLENGDRSGNYPSGDDIKDEGILFLSTKNIIGNKLDLSKAAFISADKFESLTQGKARRGDLVITLRGTLGSCCIFSCSHDKAFVNAQMMLIRPGNLVSSMYLHALLTTSAFQMKLQSLGYGAAVRQLSSGQLSKLAIPVPPISLQDQFARLLGRTLEISSACDVRHQAMNALVRSLQLCAFSGEGHI